MKRFLCCIWYVLSLVSLIVYYNSFCTVDVIFEARRKKSKGCLSVRKVLRSVSIITNADDIGLILFVIISVSISSRQTREASLFYLFANRAPRRLWGIHARTIQSLVRSTCFICIRAEEMARTLMFLADASQNLFYTSLRSSCEADLNASYVFADPRLSPFPE